MNKHNLIRLGVLAQKHFSMKDNFDIMEVPSSHQKHFRVAIPDNADYGYRPSVPIDFDDVELIKFGSQDNFEFVWCGYSFRANKLLIQEN